MSVRIEDFETHPTAIEGLMVLRVKHIHDERGTIREFFRASAMREAGLVDGPWQQLNLTETGQGAVRGLHGEAMTKLVSVVAGEVFGAYVDTRPARPPWAPWSRSRSPWAPRSWCRRGCATGSSR